MLRLGIISDIHLELCRKAVPLDVFRMSAPDQPLSSWAGPSIERLIGNVDLVLLAGDIDSNTKGITYANVLAGFLGVPVAYVCGNHELYGSHLALPDELQRECFDCLNVYFLENERFDLEIAGRARRRFSARLSGPTSCSSARTSVGQQWTPPAP